MKFPVPFFGNTPDNFHCFQAALRMVLGYYLPGKTYNWEELDGITAHTANYTWPSAGLLYCASIGFSLRLIDDVAYERFFAEGYEYLAELYGEEAAEKQRVNSDLVQEMRLAKELVKSIPIESRIPTRSDIIQAIDEENLIICNVNSCMLVGDPGYSGHFVVVIGASERGVWLHDPGLPPRPNAFVKWNRFEPAWSYPTDRVRNVMAFKLPRA